MAVDLGSRRMWISDHMVERAIRAGAERLDDFELLDLTWRDDTYRLRARVKSRTVSVNVLPRSALWDAQSVTVRATTPTPLDLEDAPVANWFVARFIEVLGGTAMAASILTRQLPEGLRWDGREVMWQRPLDLGMSGLKTALANGATATATFSHEAAGVWITVDAVPPVALALVKDVLTIFGTKI